MNVCGDVVRYCIVFFCVIGCVVVCGCDWSGEVCWGVCVCWVCVGCVLGVCRGARAIIVTLNNIIKLVNVRDVYVLRW